MSCPRPQHGTNVCMHVCAWLCAPMRTHVYAHTCLRTHILAPQSRRSKFVHMYIFPYIYTCMYIQICMRVRACTNIPAGRSICFKSSCMNTHTHTHIYIYTHQHTYAHAHCTYIHVCSTNKAHLQGGPEEVLGLRVHWDLCNDCNIYVCMYIYIHICIHIYVKMP